MEGDENGTLKSKFMHRVNAPIPLFQGTLSVMVYYSLHHRKHSQHREIPHSRTGPSQITARSQGLRDIVIRILVP